MKNGFTYDGANLREISFPIGGIGTGSVGFAGNGRFVDWEIANRPNKGSLLGHSGFMVKAVRRDGSLADARAMQSDIERDMLGQFSGREFSGFGFGPSADTLAGFPHFSGASFDGRFPIAKLALTDPGFPGAASVTAWNPMIPLDEDDSSLPAALFEVAVENTSCEPLDYSFALTLRNWFGECDVNKAFRDGALTGVELLQTKYGAGDVNYGELAVATDSPDASAQCYWYRGSWFDGATVFWRNFTEGRLPERDYENEGGGDHATLVATVSAAPGQTARARFAIAWYFPNNYNYWSPLRDEEGVDESWKNWYATKYSSAREVASHCLRDYAPLFSRTAAFRDVLYGSTLPEAFIEAAAATMSVLKSPTVLRLEDGSIYGWEGVHEHAGSCEGTCEHVWNYAYALPFLFPKLERSMRELDYKYNQFPDGRLRFRLTLPIGRPGGWDMPCADGQFGGVLKTYRDWKLCGDTEWLKTLWPAVRRSIEFAWDNQSPVRWDADCDGVLEGRQHHTLDMELFSPSSWLEGFYLGALKAGKEMAEAIGDDGFAAKCGELFERGKRFTDTELFNGEYYDQKIDLSDRSVLDGYEGETLNNGEKPYYRYWNDESSEIKYQIGHGSSIDQCLAQWHADISGLGDIFDPEKLDTALHSIYKYNFKRCMRDYFNPCRVFSANGEAGTVICAYPDGVYQPVIPIPYCQETMHGFEYSAAALMLSRGMTDEAIELTAAVRERYDGAKRNPWNEIECGSNYARSMASWSFIPLSSGFTFDMTRRRIGFAPKFCNGGIFRSFWSVGSAWGEVEIADGKSLTLRVLGGSIALDGIDTPFVAADSVIFPAIITEGNEISVVAK